MSVSLFAKNNRGLLLDVVVFILNLFLMRRLTGLFIDLFHVAQTSRPAQFALSLAPLAMWLLPAAGAVMKRWHLHQRLTDPKKLPFESSSGLAGCLFNPIFYFCLNLVLVSVIMAGLGEFIFGKALFTNGAIFVPTLLTGMIFTIVQTFLIYRYFSPPKKPPRWKWLQTPESELIGDICIFLNMILFQVVWNLLTTVPFGRPGGIGEFLGRLFFLSFIALLIYFPPRMFYLVEDIDRGRTWVTMLLANSPVIIRILIGTRSGWE